ncbi:MAG: DUF6265 family protein [Bacteroidota bacterium]
MFAQGTLTEGWSALTTVKPGSVKKYTAEDFNWLGGFWYCETAKDKTIEYWQNWKGTIEGEAYCANNKKPAKISFSEELRLDFVNGTPVYVAKVEGQNNGQPVKFPLLQANANTFVFENLKHDFPQRIIYKIRSADSLEVTIEGPGKNGKTFSETLHMAKLTCEGWGRCGNTTKYEYLVGARDCLNEKAAQKPKTATIKKK